MDLTYLELFAGAGGMSLGLETAGWRCVAHAEIEPHARAVLRHRWPDVPLYGDVAELDGTQFRGVTMVTGGSPCQDLSIAGKRAGMTEGSGTRSSLFFEQVRIWNESQAPYILWENVYGAFSSNAGRDFSAVLSALVGGAVPVPADGWVRAGVVAGPTGVAAWRTLDAQYFGVPQRRRRVFVLGVRGGGVDPAEILSLAESLSGHLATSGEAREGVAADAGAGAAVTFDARGNGDVVNTMAGDHQNRVTDYTAIVLRNREGKPGGGKGPLLSAERSLTLGTSNDQVVFAMASGQANAETAKDISPSLTGLHEQPIAFRRAGVPRRLTPVECERLMGWPDQHTAHGISEAGKPYALADTARYKLCGNGIASPVTAWIGFQLRHYLTSGKPFPIL
jgi:DNA (cytosine-5)-methyltransferase 1